MRCIVATILAQIVVASGLAVSIQSKTGSLITTSSPSATSAISVQIQAQPTTFSAISSSSSSSTSFLFLSVTGSAPDPLGISQVSGYYGPGAWAAWFLTIVASWVRIIRKSEKKFDPNTALFLLGMNWAAVDVFRDIQRLRTLHKDALEYQQNFEKSMGSYAAGFTVVFWGTVHAVLQIPFTISCFEENEKCARRRIWILAMGLILPLVALTGTAIGLVSTGLDGHGTDFFPALYWKGIANQKHSMMFWLAARAGIVCLLPTGCFTLLEPEARPDWANRFLLYLNNSMRTSLVVLLTMASFFMFTTIFFFFAMPSFAGTKSWQIGTMIFSAFYLAVLGMLILVARPVLMFGPLCWIIYLIWNTLKYIFSFNYSESCFFMPCTAQSILDEDQLYGLFAGLAIFLGTEVCLPLYDKYKDRQLRERLMEG